MFAKSKMNMCGVSAANNGVDVDLRMAKGCVVIDLMET
jgi:hypothetical protein